MKYKHANLKNTRVQCLAGLKNKQKNSLVGEKSNCMYMMAVATLLLTFSWCFEVEDDESSYGSHLSVTLP